MNKVIILGVTLVALALLFSSAWAEVVLWYEIVTYHPYCTAMHVDYLEAATRLTPLRSYNNTEIINGVSMYVQITESQASEIVQSLLNRSKIYSVQRIGSYDNETSWPIEINPNAEKPRRNMIGLCYPDTNIHPESDIYDALVRMDQRLSGVTGSSSSLGFTTLEGNSELLVNWFVATPNGTAMAEYLTDNGGKVYGLDGIIVDGVIISDGVRGEVPVSLLPFLEVHDNFTSMWPLAYPIHVSLGIGSNYTEGLEAHQHVLHWHDAGYNGTGVKVGVIDIGFTNITDSISSGDIPIPIIKCEINTLEMCEYYSDDDHGTQVAEILMDIAPGAELFIGKIGGADSVYDITSWMLKQGVDVIVQSVLHLYFEGPGDGTYYYARGSLAAIDLAVANGTTWVNAAGNLNRQTWYAESPKINPQNLFRDMYTIDFIASSIKDEAENRVELANGKEYRFVLRWAGGWFDDTNRPIDLNLYLYDSGGEYVVGGIMNQSTMDMPSPIEFITYTPSNSGTYRLVIESVGGSSPQWIQLISYDANLEFTTGHAGHTANSYSLGNEAESSSRGILVVGAVDHGGNVKSYSSVGPTIDGRTKPDLVARTDVTTSLGPLDGTSAATPHVGGMVALYYGYTNANPASIVNYMKNNAERSSINNVTGYGFAHLPNIVTPISGHAAPTTGVYRFVDTQIHQGRSSQYGIFIHDADQNDTLTYTVTSSNPKIVAVSGSKRTMSDTSIQYYRSAVIYLMPHSAGTSTITVTISDGRHELVKSFNVTVTSNHHPVLEDVDSPHIVYPGPHNVLLKATDIDNDTLTYMSILPPHNNIVTLSTTENTITISPTNAILNVTGQVRDQIILTWVSDGNGGFDYDAFVTCLAASNKAPSSTPVSNQTVENTRRVTVPISASDADGDRIVFATPYSGNSKTVAASIDSNRLLYTQTDIGSVTSVLALENMTVRDGVMVSATLSGQDTYGNTLRYTLNGTNIVPPLPQSITLSSNTKCPSRAPTSTTVQDNLQLSGLAVGNTTVSLSALDAWGGRVIQNITVTVLPMLPPTISDIPNQTLPVGNSTTIMVNATDNYQTTLQYKASSSNATAATVSPTTFTNLGSGKISITAKAQGTSVINVTVSDGNLEAYKTFTVAVTGAPSFDTSIPNQTYTQGVTASLMLPAAIGGSSPLTYTISGTPTGMAFNATTRTISGTPTGTQLATSYTYTVSDTISRTANLTFTITIQGAAPSFDTAIPNQTYTRGVATSFTLPEAVGGAGNLTYAINGTLPSGLSFDNTTRTIRGTPTTVQNALSYTYVATDTAHNTDTISFTITIRDAFVDTPTITRIIPGTHQLTIYWSWSGSFCHITGTHAGYEIQYRKVGESWRDSYYVTKDNPNNSINGAFYMAKDFGNGTISESFTINTTAKDAQGNVGAKLDPVKYEVHAIVYSGICESWSSYSATKSGTPLADASPTFGTHTISDQSYTKDTQITSLTLPQATGGTGNLTYSITPTLPSGLSFDNVTRIISGTPTTTQSDTTYTYTATDTLSKSTTITFDIAIQDTLPTFGTHTISDQSYTKDTQITSLTLPQATGGTGNLTYSITPTLPSGLSFDNVTRIISGTPTTTQSDTTYTYTATDTLSKSTTITFDIAIQDTLPTFGTHTISDQSYTKDTQITSLTLPQATGGTGNLTYSITPTLPSGLSFDNVTRIISGTPTTTQSDTTYTYTATDTLSKSTTITFDIAIQDTLPTFGTHTISDQSYTKDTQITSLTLPQATGGTGNLTYSITPTLPSGLSFDNVTRIISGTPTTTQSDTTYTYTATDTLSKSTTITFDIAIQDTLPTFGTHTISDQSYTKDTQITSLTLPQATGGTGNLTYSITPTLPSGLSFDNVTRIISGTPTTTQSDTTYTYTATDTLSKSTTITFDIAIQDTLPTFGTHTISDQSYTKDTQITSLTLPQATGGTGNLTYSITPTLPSGLSFDNVTRIISGTPTTTQSDTTYTYTATDTLSKSTTITFSITIRDAFLAAPAITSITPGTNHLTINWSWSGSSCYITGLHAGYEILYRKVGESWRDSYYVTKDNPNNSINGAYSISKDYGNNQVSESFIIDKSARDSQGNEGANLDPAEYEVIMIVYSGTCSTWSHYSDAKRGTPSG